MVLCKNSLNTSGYTMFDGPIKRLSQSRFWFSMQYFRCAVLWEGAWG